MYSPDVSSQQFAEYVDTGPMTHSFLLSQLGCKGVMLNLAVVSDLHHSPYNAVDVESVAARVHEANPDMLLIVGDIANCTSYFKPALKLLSGRWKTLVLAGNHDVWSAPKNHLDTSPARHGSQDLWESVLPRLTAEVGALWLEGTSVVIPEIGLGIAGTIGWYDYSADQTGRDAKTISCKKGKYVQDAELIDWSWSDIEFAKACRERLESALKNLASNPQVDQVLVASHIPPFLELRSDITKGNQRSRYELSNAYYFVPSLGAMIVNFPKVTHVVSGHTHFGVRKTITRDPLPPIEAYVLDNLDENEIVLHSFEHQ